MVNSVCPVLFLLFSFPILEKHNPLLELSPLNAKKSLDKPNSSSRLSFYTTLNIVCFTTFFSLSFSISFLAASSSSISHLFDPGFAAGHQKFISAEADILQGLLSGLSKLAASFTVKLCCCCMLKVDVVKCSFLSGIHFCYFHRFLPVYAADFMPGLRRLLFFHTSKHGLKEHP